jgi:hypothetical protein
MKKVLLLAVMAMLFSITGFSQENFKWDVKDSIPKTKDQIYSLTKLFIADYWKSAQNVIQSDDKESGVVLIKGNVVLHKNFQLNDHVYTFPYTIKFYMKENKYRILIDNIYCESATCGGYDWPKLSMTFEYPGYLKTSLSKNRFTEILSEVHDEMNSIISGYKKYLSNSNNDNW